MHRWCNSVRAEGFTSTAIHLPLTHTAICVYICQCSTDARLRVSINVFCGGADHQSLPQSAGLAQYHSRLLQIRLRHESRDKYVIHISKTAFKKCYFWNAALLWEHYGAAERHVVNDPPLLRWGATYWYVAIEVNFFPNFKLLTLAALGGGGQSPVIFRK